MSNPRFKCAITEELLPENEVCNVDVFKQTESSHGHFDTEKIGTKYISKEYLDYPISVLTFRGEIIMICRQDEDCYSPDNAPNNEYIKQAVNELL